MWRGRDTPTENRTESWDEIHSSLSAIIRQHSDPVVVAVDVCICWCKAHMGPPAAVPLRDVPCVMILLHLSSSISPSLLTLPRALTSGKTLRCDGDSVKIRRLALVNGGEKCVYTLTQRGTLHGTVGSSRGYFLMPYSCLTSGVHAACPLHHLCSRMSTLPPADNPSEEKKSLYDAFLTPLLRLQAVTPLRSLNFTPPLKSIFTPSKDEGKKMHERKKKKRKRLFHLSPNLAESQSRGLGFDTCVTRYWNCCVKVYHQQLRGLSKSQERYDITTPQRGHWMSYKYNVLWIWGTMSPNTPQIFSIVEGWWHTGQTVRGKEQLVFASNQSLAVRFRFKACGETGRKKRRRANPYFWEAQICALALCEPGCLFIPGSTINWCCHYPFDFTFQCKWPGHHPR